MIALEKPLYQAFFLPQAPFSTWAYPKLCMGRKADPSSPWADPAQEGTTFRPMGEAAYLRFLVLVRTPSAAAPPPVVGRLAFILRSSIQSCAAALRTAR